MDRSAVGEELSQLARLLFDSAATKWYGAFVLEVIGGIAGAVVNVTNPSEDVAIISALVLVALLGVAYGLRLWFEDQYDTAETMRRQAVLTEALNWPVPTLQLAEWRRKAGRTLAQRVRLQPRPSDYYSRAQSTGARRLAQMTAESAFYTRHLYLKLRTWVWMLFAVFTIISLVVLSVTATGAVPTDAKALVVKGLYSLVPLVITLDILGWALRLGRLVVSIRDVESALERLGGTSELEEPQVLRVVSEYNCQVTKGFPVHPFLFKWWHDEIMELWNSTAQPDFNSRGAN